MPPVAPTKPTLELLRSLSDEHVLRALMSQRQATRAEIATATGLSKPTVSESVRRLSANGSVVDTGERTTGRGRVGTYYALPATTGGALVVSLAPEGIVAEAVDVYGEVVARSQAPVSRSPGAGEVARTLSASPARWRRARSGSPSSAPPIPWTVRPGGSSSCPDAPFLLGALDAPAVLAELVDGPVTVDNDVNWAARAEHGHGRGVRDFVYLFLGEGLGCAVRQRRGGPARPRRAGRRDRAPGDGRSRRGGDAADGRLRRARPSPLRLHGDRRAGAARPSSRHGAAADALGRAVAGVLSAVVALADPAVVLVGGSWGRDPRVLRRWRASSPMRPATSRSKPPRSTTSPRWPRRARRRCSERSNSSATACMCVSSAASSSRVPGDSRAAGRVTIANVLKSVGLKGAVVSPAG